MQSLGHYENRERGTFQFPCEFHHVDDTHPRYEMLYHWHPEYEIIRILEGEFTVTLNEAAFTAKKGSFIFVHSSVLHSGIPKDCLYQCIVFDLNFLLKHGTLCKPNIQRIISQEITVYHHLKPENCGSLACLHELFDAFSSKETGYELIVLGEFYHFFGLVFQHHWYLEAAPASRNAYRRIAQLKQALEFIGKNYTAPVTLDDMAGSLSMSPRYFCRFFKEMTHHSPVDYLNRQRIEEACYLLSASDASVTEVAYACGFNDLSYFIRMFKHHMGVSPGQYKKN